MGSGTEAIDRKQRIRDRYRGVDTSELEVIPAKAVEGLGESTSIRRVAAYVRVSTDNDEQTSSYELQKNYYTDYIKAQPGWEFVGIYDDEGIGTLIKVCKELPDVQFIFAGTGPLEETVNGIKNIKNVGFQKGEALEKLIREARFSIYPSEWYENCPFSVMESQMYGTPVLGANIGGIPELIQVGKTGELFESGNAEDLKKKIEKLWGDKKLCEQYSKNCKDISFDTIDEYYEKIMKVYQ